MPLDPAVILKHVNQKLLAQFVVIQSMSVICQNIVRDTANFVPMMCTKSMEHHVRLAKRFVLGVLVGHIQISANCYGEHPGRSLTVNATNKIEKEPDMEIVATTGSTSPILNVRIRMSDVVSVF